MRRHPDGYFDDEELVREEGVLVPRHGGREVGPEGAEGAPGDYVEDPRSDDGVPGTRDDLPLDYGIEIPAAADHLLAGPDRVHVGFGGMGSTGYEQDRDESPLGGPEERELWRKQRPLIEEAEAEERHVAGLEGLDQGELEDAQAEGAEDPLADSSGGRSATGAT